MFVSVQCASWCLLETCASPVIRCYPAGTSPGKMGVRASAQVHAYSCTKVSKVGWLARARDWLNKHRQELDNRPSGGPRHRLLEWPGSGSIIAHRPKRGAPWAVCHRRAGHPLISWSYVCGETASTSTCENGIGMQSAKVTGTAGIPWLGILTSATTHAIHHRRAPTA